MGNIANSVGRRLRALREARRLTQDEAADLIGVSRNTWYSYESGKFALTVAQIEEIAGKMKVPAMEILGGVSFGPEDAIALLQATVADWREAKTQGGLPEELLQKLGELDQVQLGMISGLADQFIAGKRSASKRA